MKVKQNFVERILNLKIFVVLIGITLLSAGCGGGTTGPTGPVTIKVWKVFEGSEHFQQLIDDYQKTHKGVQIEYTQKNSETYEADLLNALAAGQGPDIFSINNSWVPKYLDKITPLPETPVDKTFNFSTYKKDFVDALVNDFTKDGKIYGVALAVDSLALYYNKDLLGSAGIATPARTWQELALQAQKIKRQDKVGYFTRSGAALGTSSNINRAVDILYLLMLQKGVQPFSEDRLQATFAQGLQQGASQTNPGQEALEYYTSFALPYSLNYNWNLKSDYSIDAFANGRLAYLYGYAYTRSVILQKNPNLNFDVAPVPQPNLENPTVNFANYWGEVVSSQSKYPAAAWDFLKFLSSQKSLDSYYAKNKQPSSRRDLIDLQVSDPEIGVFANANLTAKSFYKPDQVKMDTIFSDMIDSVILKGFEAMDALSEAEQKAQTLVRW